MPVGRDARNEKEQRDGTAIGFGCRDSGNFWEGIRGLGMIELNDEKLLKIIFSACFILVDFQDVTRPAVASRRTGDQKKSPPPPRIPTAKTSHTPTRM